jgi:hypothetical protein
MGTTQGAWGKWEIDIMVAAGTKFPAMVYLMFMSTKEAQGAEGSATSFRQGRRNLTKVQAVLAALARMGFVSTTDGGRRLRCG